MSSRFKTPKFTRSQKSDTKSADSDTPLIIAFYDPEIRAEDARHRTLEEILLWPDQKLESCHNYIQMLFPVPEGSMYNWEASIIDRRVMDAFRSRPELREQLLKSFERLLKFYGFAVAETEETSTKMHNGEKEAEAQQEDDATEVVFDEETTQEASQNTSTTQSTTAPPDAPSQVQSSNTYTIIRGPNWFQKSRNWTDGVDHNHLRITRILRCLRVLGLQQQCDAFYAALQIVFDDPAVRISERSMTYWKRAATRSLYIAPDGDRIEWLREWEQEQE